MIVLFIVLARNKLRKRASPLVDSLSRQPYETHRIGGGLPLRAQGMPSSKIGDSGRQP